MNEVFLEGTIAAVNKVKHLDDACSHLVCRLRVSHRDRKNQVKVEFYTINVWDRLAEWAEKSLTLGMPVCIKGYLTQQRHDSVVQTEVTAGHFFIKQPKSMPDDRDSTLPNG